MADITNQPAYLPPPTPEKSLYDGLRTIPHSAPAGIGNRSELVCYQYTGLHLWRGGHGQNLSVEPGRPGTWKDHSESW